MKKLIIILVADEEKSFTICENYTLLEDKAYMRNNTDEVYLERKP